MKKNFYITVCSTLAVLLTLATFIAFVDPYQQYHNRPDKYCGVQRSEISGIARRHDFNAFLMGSSMSMNHYPEQADSLWGWNTKNFSIMGATYDDYEVILPFVMRQGKAKNVILNVDAFSFARQRQAVPRHLYDDNYLNDYLYLCNYTSLKHAINYLLHPSPLKSLYHFNSPVGRQHLLDDFNNKYVNSSYEGEVYDIDALILHFDNSLLKAIADADNDVIWYVYFPPYSIGEFVLLDKYGDLEAFLQWKEHASSEFLKLPNVKLYDFQVEPWITNLDEYMDVRHHSHSYNRAILETIHSDSNRVKEPLKTEFSEIYNLIKVYQDSLICQ